MYIGTLEEDILKARRESDRKVSPDRTRGKEN